VQFQQLTYPQKQHLDSFSVPVTTAAQPSLNRNLGQSFDEVNHPFDNNEFLGAFGIRHNNTTTFNFHPRTLNLSSFQLSQADLNILNLVFKFNFNFEPKIKDLQVFAANIERVISTGIPPSDQGNIRSSCVTHLNKFYS